MGAGHATVAIPSSESMVRMGSPSAPGGRGQLLAVKHELGLVPGGDHDGFVDGQIGAGQPYQQGRRIAVSGFVPSVARSEGEAGLSELGARAGRPLT